MSDERENGNVNQSNHVSLRGAVVLLIQGRPKVNLQGQKLINQLQAPCMCFVTPM